MKSSLVSKGFVAFFIFLIMLNFYQYGKIKELKTQQRVIAENIISNYQTALVITKDVIEHENINDENVWFLNVLLTETGNSLNLLLTSIYDVENNKISEFYEYLATNFEYALHGNNVSEAEQQKILDDQVELLRAAIVTIETDKVNSETVIARYNDFLQTWSKKE